MHETPNLQELPTKSISKVYHVGNLDADANKNTFSYEGKGLSVSKHPNAWRKISSNVSGKTYILTYPESSNTFYLADTVEPREQIVDWCAENRYIKCVDGWKAAVHDPETSEWRFTKYYDYDEATRCSEAHIKDNAYIEQSKVLKLEKKGKEYWNSEFPSEADSASPVAIRGLTPIWFAQEQDADGVWWSYRLDPASLTAPKGVIFQDKLPKWKITEEN